MQNPENTTSSSSTSDKSSWMRRIIKGFITLIIIGCLSVAALHLPAVQTRLIPLILKKPLASAGFKLDFRTLHINIFTGELTGRGLHVLSIGEMPWLDVTVDSIEMDFAMLTMLNTPSITSLKIHRPFVTLRPSQIPESEPSDESGGELPGFVLAEISISEGRFEIDPPHPEEFGMVLEGIAVDGSLDLAPFISQGDIHAQSMVLSGPAPLKTTGETQLNFHLTGGGSGTGTLHSEIESNSLESTFTVKDLLGDLSYATELSLKGAPEDVLNALGITDLVKGHVTLSADVNGGTSGLDEFELILEGDAFSMAGIPVADFGLTGRFPDFKSLTAELTAHAAGGELTVSTAGVMIPDPDNFHVLAEIKDVNITDIAPLKSNLPGVTGRADSSIDLIFDSWEPDGIRGILTLHSKDARFTQDDKTIQSAITVKAALDRSQLDISDLNLESEIFNGQITGGYDMNTGGFNLESDIQFSDLSPALTFAGLQGSGAGQMKIDGSGTFSDPHLNGFIRLRDVEILEYECHIPVLDVEIIDRRFTFTAPGINYSGVTGNVDVTGNAVKNDTRLTWDLATDLTGLKYQKISAPDLNASLVLSDGIDLTVRSADQQLEGTFNYVDENAFTGNIVLNGFNLAMFRPVLPDNMQDSAGTLTGNINIKKDDLVDLPVVTCEIAGLDAATGKLHVWNTEPFVAAFEDNKIVVSSFQLETSGNGRIVTDGTVDLTTKEMAVHMVMDFPDLSSMDSFMENARGKVTGNFTLGGTFDHPSPQGNLSVQNLHLAGIDTESMQMVITETIPGEPIRVKLTVNGFQWDELIVSESIVQCDIDGPDLRLSTRLFDGQLTMESTLNLTGEMPFSADITLNGFDLEPIFSWMAPDFETGGNLSGTCGVNGFIEDPERMRATIDLSQAALTAQAVALRNKSPVIIRLDDGIVSFDSFNLEGAANRINVTGNIPLSDPGDPMETNDPGTDTGLIIRSTLALKTFLPVLDDLDRFEGDVNGDFRVVHSLSDPEIFGEFTLENGAVNGANFPELQNINGKAVFKGETIQLDPLTATMGTGTLRVTGEIPIQSSGRSKMDLTIKGHNLEMDLGSEFDMVSDVDLMVAYQNSLPLIKGSIDINDALYTPEFNLMELLASITNATVDFERSFDFGQKESKPGILDVAIIIPDSLNVQSGFLDIVTGGNLRVEGPWNNPVIKGIIKLPNGSFSILGAEFEIITGTVHFSDPYQIDPDLNIVAVTEKDGDEITLKITGKTSQANLALSSSSGLSQEQILRRLAGMDGESSGDGWDDALMDAAKRAVAEKFTQALGERTDLIIVPFPVTEDSEEMIFGIGKKVGDKVTVMYYKSADTNAGDTIVVTYEMTSDTTLRVKQNSDDSISGGVSHQITFN